MKHLAQCSALSGTDETLASHDQGCRGGIPGWLGGASQVGECGSIREGFTEAVTTLEGRQLCSLILCWGVGETLVLALIPVAFSL